MGLFSDSSATSDPFAGLMSFFQMQQANQTAKLGQDWLSFAKDQFNVSNERQKNIDALTAKVTDSQLKAQDTALGWANEDRARYKSIFQPLQDKFIEKAQNWDSPDAQAQAAAEAKADVANSMAEQRGQSERAMAANGVRPDSGAWAGTDRALQLQGGLASAGAQNTARRQLRNEAMALQGEAINLGNGLPTSASTSLGQGVSAGSSATGNIINANNSWRGGVDIMNSGYGGAMNAGNYAGNMYSNLYGNRVNMLNASDQMRSSAVGSIFGALGTGVGMYAGMKSSRDAKEDKREVRGVLDALKSLPIEAWSYKEGEGDGGEHIGTYAEDFKRATGLGDGQNINIIDALGVTMGAVKELAEKVDGDAKTEKHDEKPVKTAARKPKSIMMRAAA